MIHEDGSCIRILTAQESARIMIGLLWHERHRPLAKPILRHYLKEARG